MDKPQWVLDKEKLKYDYQEPLEFVGELGVDGVINGKLPNGEEYQWFKRRKDKL